MKQIKQTKRGSNGNCFQAVLASMLELDLDSVPDFCNLYPNNDGQWFRECNTWLNKMGLGFIGMSLEGKELAVIDENQAFKGHYIVDIKQAHLPYNHVVIMKNNKIIFDPMSKYQQCKPPFNAYYIVVDDILKLRTFLTTGGTT